MNANTRTRIDRPAGWVPALALATLLPLAACDDSSTDNPPVEPMPTPEELTYYGDIKAIIDQSCVSCHQPGGIAPFSLTTLEEVTTHRYSIAAAVESGSMPPWQPGEDCNTYVGDFSLPADQREALLAWLAGSMNAGDPADSGAPSSPPAPFQSDLTLKLPEPYTPQGNPDDYRCLLVDWPEATDTYVTGFQIYPDQAAEVHHVILYKLAPDQVDEFRAMDAAEDGPGYNCFGGAVATGSTSTVRPAQIGGWTPGSQGTRFPEGTGIRVEAGSMLIVQMHYNNSYAEPTPDQTSFAFTLASTVERPALMQLITNPAWLMPSGMRIPAGEADAYHGAALDLGRLVTFLGGAEIGLAYGDPLAIHNVGLHMHQLGTRGRVAVKRLSGAEECLLEIPAWDFHWQGTYGLGEEVVVQSNDRLLLDCWWDNSMTNQPIINGQQAMPVDVSWGEGTRDEMCLTMLYITAAP